MGYLTWWNFPKKAWIIILSELSVIAYLSISFYLVYLNDAYFQAYANGLSPLVVPLLSVGFGLSSASIATYMYLGMKRVRSLQRAQPILERKMRSHRIKQVQESPPHQTKPLDSQETARKNLKPLAPSPIHPQKQIPSSKEHNNDARRNESNKQS